MASASAGGVCLSFSASCRAARICGPNLSGNRGNIVILSEWHAGMIPVAMIAERLFWLRTILVQEWSLCPVVIGTLRNGCCCGLLSDGEALYLRGTIWKREQQCRQFQRRRRQHLCDSVRLNHYDGVRRRCRQTQYLRRPGPARPTCRSGRSPNTSQAPAP